MPTYAPKAGDTTRSWYVIDATDVVLGRLAVAAATLLRGKHKPTFAPNVDGGDFVIEVDNKSLTHRPDLWGHHGMAREVAAILGIPLRDPVKPAAVAGIRAPIRVSIENYALCPRYSALDNRAWRALGQADLPPWRSGLRDYLTALGRSRAR